MAHNVSKMALSPLDYVVAGLFSTEVMTLTMFAVPRFYVSEIDISEEITRDCTDVWEKRVGWVCHLVCPWRYVTSLRRVWDYIFEVYHYKIASLDKYNEEETCYGRRCPSFLFCRYLLGKIHSIKSFYSNWTLSVPVMLWGITKSLIRDRKG